MSSRPFAPRTEQQRAAVQARQAFPGSVAGSVRNAGPVSQAGRTAVRVPTSTTLSAETFWVEDHFSVSASALGPFTLSYVPRANSEDVKLNGVGVRPTVEWTRSGVTLTLDPSVTLGIGTDTWDLTVQYEVSSSVALPVTESYALAVLALSPLAYWPLTETSGAAAADVTGHGYNGAYTGGVALGQASIAPGLAGSAKFTAASSQYVDATALVAASLQTSYTVTAWCKPTTIQGGGAAAGVLIGAAYDGATEAFVVADNAGSWFAGGKWSGTHWDFTAGPGLVVGNAYFVCSVYDGSRINLYVNGVLLGSSAVAGAMPAAPPNGCTIGTNDDGAHVQFWDGYISDVAIFATALPTSDITNLYSIGSP